MPTTVRDEINPSGKRLPNADLQGSGKRLHGREGEPVDYTARLNADFPFYFEIGSDGRDARRLYHNAEQRVFRQLSPGNQSLLKKLCHSDFMSGDIDQVEMAALAHNLLDIFTNCDEYSLFCFIYRRAPHILLDAIFDLAEKRDFDDYSIHVWIYICKQEIYVLDNDIGPSDSLKLAFCATVINDSSRLPEFLKGANGQLDNIQDAHGRSLIHLAAGFGACAVMDILLDDKRNSYVRDKAGNTPLHTAAIRGKTDAANLLLLAGADPDVQNEAETTPLSLAISFGHIDTACKLIPHAANLYVLDEEGINALPAHMINLLICSGYYMTETLREKWEPLSFMGQAVERLTDAERKIREAQFQLLMPRDINIRSIQGLVDDLEKPEQSKIIAFLQPKLPRGERASVFPLVARNWIHGFANEISGDPDDCKSRNLVFSLLRNALRLATDIKSKDAEIRRLRRQVRELAAVNVLPAESHRFFPSPPPAPRQEPSFTPEAARLLFGE